MHLVVADGKVYENYNYVQIHDARLRPFGIKLRKQGMKATYNTHENFPRQLMSKRYINYFLYKPVSLILEWSEDYDATKRFNFIITATPPTQKRFSKFYNASLDVNKYPLLSE